MTKYITIYTAICAVLYLIVMARIIAKHGYKTWAKEASYLFLLLFCPIVNVFSICFFIYIKIIGKEKVENQLNKLKTKHDTN